MKLKVNVPYIKLKLSALTTRMTVAVGEFISAIVRSDSASITDLFSKRPTKIKTETTSVSDVFIKLPRKNLSSGGALYEGGDPPYFLEDYVIGGPDNQTYTLVGGFNKRVLKVLNETPVVTDVIAKSLPAKSINETVNVTDDVNGAATGDDQVMQYFKVTTDLAGVSDGVVQRSIGRGLSETISTISAGSLSIQDYTVDMSYFLEDYVGVGRSWSYGKREFSDAPSVVSSGLLVIQDYAESTYFAEDYVGTSRSFT